MEGQAMRIGVIGTGAVGLYYGARLQRAGHDVHFLARSDYRALRETGARVRAPDGDFELPKLRVYDAPERMPVCDLVIIALKATANDQLAQLAGGAVGPSTVLLTLQNGLGNDALLQSIFPEHRILSGLCFVCINRVSPGEVENYMLGSISLGAFSTEAGEAAETVGAALTEAGANCRVASDLPLQQWKKLVWNVPFNGLAVVAGGITTDKILADAGLREEAMALMEEIRQGAAALGLAIKPDFPQKQIDLTLTMGAYKPSSLVDYLARRSVEVEAIWGEPYRRAKEAGLELTRLGMLYHLLSAICAGR